MISDTALGLPKQAIGFMQEAIRLSGENLTQLHGGPFGAVIVKDNVIIGQGYNQVLHQNDPTAHAEIQAIRDACKRLQTYDLSGTEIYTSCEPCPMCLGAIFWARIQTIYYGNAQQDAAAIGFDDAQFYQEMAKPIDERKIPTKRLLASEAKAVFDAWAEKPDKPPY